MWYRGWICNITRRYIPWSFREYVAFDVGDSVFYVCLDFCEEAWWSIFKPIIAHGDSFILSELGWLDNIHHQRCALCIKKHLIALLGLRTAGCRRRNSVKIGAKKIYIKRKICFGPVTDHFDWFLNDPKPQHEKRNRIQSCPIFLSSQKVIVGHLLDFLAYFLMNPTFPQFG